MPDQVPEEVKEERQAEIMELQQEIVFDQAEAMIGREVLVMIEGKVADENAMSEGLIRMRPTWTA